MPHFEELSRVVADLAKRLVRAEDATVIARDENSASSPVQGVFFEAGRPYSNVRSVRQLLSTLSGDVYWLDNHLDLEVLDIVASSAASGQHTSFRLLREGRLEDRLLREAKHLRQELGEMGIDFDIRCIPADVNKVHDRWIVARQGVWKLPPASALSKAGELSPSSNPVAVRALIVRLYAEANSIFGAR
jgi:hypothetical protein